MFVHSLITLSTLYIVHGQNFQPRCQEFCFDGELADKNGVCVDGSSLVPLLSAEGYNISGILTCKWFNKGPKNASLILFNRCDTDLYREIDHTFAKQLPNGSYYYELFGRNKIVHSNLYLLIRHDCMSMKGSGTMRESLLDIRLNVKCQEACQKKCVELRGPKYCDCNQRGKKPRTIGMDCHGVCKDPQSKCNPSCQELTYCREQLDLDLRYV